MAWSSSKFGAPTLRNYEQAKAHFEGTKPIRGSGLVPIGDRRKQQAKIIEYHNGDIACRLHHTDVLTYHKDNSVTINLGGWDSQSTRAFISEILPDAWVNGEHGLPWFSGHAVNGEGKVQYGKWLLSSNGKHKLERREGVSGFVLIDPQPVVQHFIKRKEANTVREQYLSFKKYVVGMVKVMEEMLGEEQLKVFHQVTGLIHPYDFRRLKPVLPRAASDDPEDKFIAMVGLIYAHHGYAIFRDDTNARHRMSYVKAGTNAMLKTLDQAILYANRDTCFEEVSSLNGECAYDSNIIFFN